MRSHRLEPGQRTMVDVVFDTVVDGPGMHGEVVELSTNTRTGPRLTFLIRVEG